MKSLQRSLRLTCRLQHGSRRNSTVGPQISADRLPPGGTVYMLKPVYNLRRWGFPSGQRGRQDRYCRSVAEWASVTAAKQSKSSSALTSDRLARSTTCLPLSHRSRACTYNHCPGLLEHSPPFGRLHYRGYSDDVPWLRLGQTRPRLW